jgi:hypothetical protein|tara:strand:+ start:185 stop:334 length:150 start_codon:yes stop_codon:yes gene_type:complete
MKKGNKLSISPTNTFTNSLNVSQPKVANPNQSMPITAKVKRAGSTKLKG